MVYYNPNDPLIGAVIEQVGLHEADKSIISLIMRRKDGKRRDVRLIVTNTGDFTIEEFPLED
jgi:hypothetical protein